MDSKHCINNIIWDKYSKSTLREPELKQIMLHVASCEICMDIKEGIDLMKKPQQLHQRVAAINHRVDDYLNPKPKHNFLFWYSSAAAIFLMAVGLSWLVFNKSNTETLVQTIKKIKKNETINVSKTDSSVLNANSKLSKEKVIVTKQMPSKPFPLFNPEAENNQMREDANLFKLGESMDDEKFSNLGSNYFVENKDIKFLNKTSDTLAQSYTFTFNEVRTANTDQLEKLSTVAIAKTESKNRGKLYKAKTASIPGNYNYSRNDNGSSEDILINSGSSTVSDSVSYQAALIDYSQLRYTACMLNLKAVVSNSNWYEDGLLLKAKSLIGLKRTKEAKTLLNQIIFMQKKHASEAKNLLSTLK